MAHKKQSPEKTVYTLLQDVASAILCAHHEKSVKVIKHYLRPRDAYYIYHESGGERSSWTRLREKFKEVALDRILKNCRAANPVNICGFLFYNLRMPVLPQNKPRVPKPTWRTKRDPQRPPDHGAP